MKIGKSFALRMTLMGALLLAVLFAGGQAQAQGDSTRQLTPGQTVTGNLTAQNFAQVYTFTGAPETPVTIIATSQTRGLPLAVLLTSGSGQIVAQASNLVTAEVALRDIRLPAAGTYFVTVLRGTGAQGQASGQFTLVYTQGEQTTSTSQTVTLQQGMTISLSWASIDDFNLEVRDPIGGSVFFNNQSVPSGGQLDGNVNGSCQNTASNPRETVSWPRGTVPSGSYEILVYYVQACAQPAQQRQFSISVTVDGKTQEVVSSTLNVGEQYVASFVLESADNFTVQSGGANPQLLNLTPFASKIAAPIDLANRSEVTGRIDRNNQADVYSFEGKTGQNVSIALSAVTGGSLDTQLIILGPDTTVVASNDDANESTRDSAVSNLALPRDGRYLIVVTRFGKNIGGTEGNYRMAVTGLSAVAVAATPAPGAATAEPTAAASGNLGLLGLPAGSIQVALLWDNRADLRLLIRDPEKRSLFSDVRELPGGAKLAQISNLNCQNTTSTPVTYAYWPLDRLSPGTYEIQLWMLNQCNEPALPNYSLSVSVRGREVINIKDKPDANGLLFVTNFTISPEGVASAGKGGIFTQVYSTDLGDISSQIASAETLVYGRASVGNIDTNSPYVLYTFQARAGDRVRIQMRSTRGSLDTFLWLADSTGAQINLNDDIAPGRDTNSRIDQTIPADGLYTVIATRFGSVYGGTTGSFELTVSPLGR